MISSIFIRIGKSVFILLQKIRRYIRGGHLRKLISRGLIVGNNFSYEKGVNIDPTYPHLIKIGNNVTMAQNVIILAHDASLSKITGLVRIGTVSIGDNVFLGCGCIVLPGVSIGDNVIVGAGAVVSKSIPSNCVCAGVPSKVISSTDDYLVRINKMVIPSRVYHKSLNPLTMTRSQKIEQYNNCLNAICFKEIDSR